MKSITSTTGKTMTTAIAKGNSAKTFNIGRNARTGELTTVKEAKQHPATRVVERMPKSGHGDTKK